MARPVTQCPVCDAPLRVTELSCGQCATRLSGVFPAPPLARLAEEHQQFITTFLRCRGVIRDVEQALEISYPTVRARLDSAVAALEALLAEADTPPAPPRPPDTADHRRELLRQVEEGVLDPSAAAEALRRL